MRNITEFLTMVYIYGLYYTKSIKQYFNLKIKKKIKSVKKAGKNWNTQRAETKSGMTLPKDWRTENEILLAELVRVC